MEATIELLAVSTRIALASIICITLPLTNGNIKYTPKRIVAVSIQQDNFHYCGFPFDTQTAFQTEKVIHLNLIS